MKFSAPILVIAAVALFLASSVALPMLAEAKNPAATGPNARVRVFHASPDAPAVDVWVNGMPAFTNLAFGELTSYAMLRFGTYRVEVVPAGQTSPVVIQADLMLRQNTDYTVMAVGELADIRPLVLIDWNDPAPADATRVRFVHASPDAPAVDIAVMGGPVLFADVAFAESGGYIEVPYGTYDLEVRLAGTDTVVMSFPGIALERATTYSAYAIGLAGDGSLTAYMGIDAESPAKPHLK